MSSKHIRTTLRGIVLSASVYKMQPKEYFSALPLDRIRMLALYKRFYRLRNFMGDKEWKTDHYCQILRRRFSREDFNTRRAKVLLSAGDTEEVEPLTVEQITDRIINTLAFVHNSTVHLPTELDHQKPTYFEDLKQPQRIETQVVATIIELDQHLPNRLKNDLTYQWITHTTAYLNGLCVESTLPQKVRDTSHGMPGTNIGYRANEIVVMGLNETMQLCL